MSTTQALKITGRVLKGIALGLLALMAGVLALLGAASRAEHERARREEDALPQYDPWARHTEHWTRYDDDGHRIW